MTLNRLFSMACAVCLTLSLAIPANAAELSASNQLSSHAGTTVTCGVAVCDMDGGQDTTYAIEHTERWGLSAVLCKRFVENCKM